MARDSSGRFSAFGVGDGTVRFRCARCGGTEMVSRNPQCAISSLVERAAAFVLKHDVCKTKRQADTERRRAEAFSPGKLADKMRFLSQGKWKSLSFREAGKAICHRSRGGGDS